MRVRVPCLCNMRSSGMEARDCRTWEWQQGTLGACSVQAEGLICALPHHVLQGELVCVVGRKGNIVPCTLMPGVKTGTSHTCKNKKERYAHNKRIHIRTHARTSARARTHTHTHTTHAHTHTHTHSLDKRKQLGVSCCTSAFCGVCSRFAVDGGVALTVVIVLTAPPVKGDNQPYEFREQPASCLVIYCHANGLKLLFACFS
jgi:hypothetical protein